MAEQFEQMLPQMEQLLQGLSSADNALRTAAEANLNDEWVVNMPTEMLFTLVVYIQKNPDPKSRAFAALIFKRMASKSITKDGEPKELFMWLPDQQKAMIKDGLLSLFAAEQDSNARKRIGDAIAEIAREIFDAEGTWDELIQALLQHSGSPNPEVREASYRIFSATPGIIEKQHAAFVSDVFRKAFSDDSVNVRIMAMEAFASFFRSIQKANHREFFPLAGGIVMSLPPLKDSQDTDNLCKALIAMIDLIEVSPSMWKESFDFIHTFGISVIQDKDMGDQARQNALELLATFADMMPNICKTNPNYASDMITQCLSFMTDVGADDEDCEEWNESEELDMDESDLNHVAGEQCLDRLANKLGGEYVLQPAFHWLPKMINSSSWRDRHAALMAISSISEGCKDMMEAELDKVLELVIPALRDAHPRVRWAGCNALGQMSTDFAGTMQNNYHQQVMEAIVPVLGSPEPRVQSHAAAALVNFCEEAEPEIIQPYLGELIERLMLLLENGKRFVQEQVLSSIATIADSAEAQFTAFYPRLMPVLFNVLRVQIDDNNKELRMLKAKAMECATLIALAVGNERMGQDAVALVRILGTIQQTVVDHDDPQSSYLLHCWGRMCRVMGNDFLPYIPAVMPPLLELASAKADVQLIDDEEHVAQVEQEDGWELVPVKGKFIGIKTSSLDDKYMAIELLVIYAQQLKASFEPWVAKVMSEIAIPGLTFFFNDPVRVAASKLLPKLLICVKESHGPQSVQLGQLWGPITEKLFTVLETEPVIETLVEMWRCYWECVEVIGPNSMGPDQMAAFIRVTTHCLSDYTTRVEQRLEEQQKPEEDRDDDELYYGMEDDENLLIEISKSVHTMLENMTSAFIPYWENLLPIYTTYIRSPDPSPRTFALGVFDDLVEFCPNDAVRYKQHFYQPILDSLVDPSPDTRNSAAYSIDKAIKAGEQFADVVTASVPKLVEATRMPNARSKDQNFATEMIAAILAKVLHTQGRSLQNLDAIVNAWIQTALPVYEDEENAAFAYTFLVGLIEASHPAVAQNLPKIFADIVTALDSEKLQGQTAERTVNAIKGAVQKAGVTLEQAAGTVPAAQHPTVKKWFIDRK